MTTHEVRQALTALEDENGRLTPESVVEAARDEASPLHDHFEWDDDKAAEAHRLNQARTLIRSVKITFKTEYFDVRTVAYVRDPDAEPRAQGYRSLESVSKDADDAREVVVREFGAAASHLARARQISVALSLEGEVDDLLRRVGALRDRLHAAPPAAQ